MRDRTLNRHCATASEDFDELEEVALFVDVAGEVEDVGAFTFLHNQTDLIQGSLKVVDLRQALHKIGKLPAWITTP